MMNAILETAISLVLIFLVFSIVTYVIQEIIAVNLRLRGKMLWKSISQLLDGFNLEGRINLMKALPGGVAGVTEDFYNNHHVKGLQQDLKKLPSYIPAANFALAIMDMVAKKAPNAAQNDLFTNFKNGLQTFTGSNGNLFAVLKNLAETSKDIQEMQQKIEKWFNDYMQRVSGWYQSHVVVTVRLIAIGVTLLFNINSIKLATTIYNNGQMRAALVAVAEDVADNPQAVTAYYDRAFDRQLAQLDSSLKQALASAKTAADTAAAKSANEAATGKAADSFTTARRQQIKKMVDTLETTGLPLGWNNTTPCKEIELGGSKSWLVNAALLLLGWFFSAMALSMGAPFWFDLLAKLVNVRRSGAKPKEAAKGTTGS
jgi:hypothetical protein